MALNTDGLSGDALKRAIAYNNAMNKAEKSMQNQQKMAKQIGQSFLGVDGSDFFRNLTDDEISKKMSELESISKSLNQEAKSAGEKLNKNFKSMMESSEFANSNVEGLSKSLNISETVAKQLLEAMNDTNSSTSGIADIIKDMGEGAESLVETLVDKGNFEETLVNQFKDTLGTLEEIDVELAVTEDRMKNVEDSVFSIGKGLSVAGENLTRDFNLTSLTDQILEFDEAIKSAQITTGINFTRNAQQMALLTSETARFGMSVQDSTELMGALGEQLRTADFDVLSNAAKDLASMQKATGLSAENTAGLAKEFVMFGRSTEEMADYAGEVMSEAQGFGLNGREIMEDIAKNMANMRRMGFVGGEQSLKRMVMEAKRLGIEVDDVFNVAKKARNIEGAMEMAAELQLAGGSFAQIDPMQLLSAARKGPEELQKILGQMGSDIGSFNEKGEFKFDPVDRDRLNMVADATGMELDSIQNMIAKNAEDAKKADLMGNAMDFGGMDDEQKNLIMSLTKIGKGGKIDISADAARMGIDSLEQLYGTNVDTLQEKMKGDKEFLEEQATQNMSFKESKEALMASITNLFSVFHPVLQTVTGLINDINKLGPIAKGIIGGAILGMKLLFGPAKSYMQGFHMGRGFNAAVSGAKGFIGKLKSGVKGIFGKVKGIFKKKDIAKDAVPDTKGAAASKGAGGGLKSLAKGLMAMGNAQAAAGAGVLLLAVPGLIAMIPAIPGLLLMGLVGAMGKTVTFGFASLARGFSILGNNMKSIILGSVAMAIIGASVIPFAFALSMMTDISWESILAGLTFMTLAAGIVIAMGMLFATGGGAVAMILGAVAMGIIAGAVLVFAYALQQLVGPAEAFQGVGFDWIFELGKSLLLASPGLLAGGLALLFAAPGLIFGAIALRPLMEVAQMASGVDWSVFSQIGPALMSVSGALIAFGAAGLAGGVMGAIGGMLGGGGPIDKLQQIADIAITAANPISVMSNALGELASNLEKFQTAAGNIDLEKLDSLRNLAWSMAIGSIGGGMGEAIDKIAQALAKLTESTSGGKGGSGQGGTVRHVVELVLDGKKLKEIELRDNKYTT